ncbi:Uncharacterised protein [Klebsiella pneumoniae]|nr:Uncharacterised protein [Klebsiella pneumoniae]
MIFFCLAGEGDGEVEFHHVASGDDGVIDLRRFTGRRCGGSTFAHGGYGGFRFFAAWEHLLGPVTQSSLSMIVPTSMAQPLVLHLSTTSSS